MDETKSCDRLVKALPIIGGVCAVVIPTSINLAMLFGILILYDGIRTDIAAYGAAIDANGVAIEALREETRSGFQEIGVNVDALSVDVDDLKPDVVQIKSSVENIERGLPDMESTADGFDFRERADAE